MPDMRKVLELAPDIRVPEPEDGERLRYSPDAVELLEKFFSLLVFGQNEWAGRPFQLAGWETDAIRQFYGVQVDDGLGGWVRYRRFLYAEIPKKNGKSEFAAGLGLYHLLADGEKLPQVGIFAADKTNADIIYMAAKYMVEHTALSQPAGKPLCWCRDSVREIRTQFGGLMKVYSSDADTKHGFSFSAIIFDELHAQPNRKLWDVLTEGSDAARRQQAVIVLTTAGDDPDQVSIAWNIHEKCRRILAWRRGEPESPTDEDDSAWCPIMYGISVMTGDDPDKIAALNIWDEAVWRACNPGYGVTISPRQFRQAAKTAKQSEAAERLFRWLRLNQWVTVKTVGWVPVTIYDKTQWDPPELATLRGIQRRDTGRALLAGKTCYGGLDLSKRTDLTAFVLLFPPQEGLDHWVTLFWGTWRPEIGVEDAENRDHVPYRDWARAGFLTLCPGDTIDYAMVEASVYLAAELYDLRVVGLDPHLSWTLTSRLMAGQPDQGHPGVNCVEIPQDMKNLSPPMQEMEKEIRDHHMLHEHNTCARWNFGNTRCRTDGNENMKPMKNLSWGRIDVTVAWIIARGTAMVDMAAHPYNAKTLREDWGL